jgi:uncharacterized membrane protein
MRLFRARNRPAHDHDTGTGRIEAFSDGVFAIAITLLIIEIGVPAVEGDESLSHELWHLWPKYFAYVLSFLVIGIYWANHHSFMRLFVQVDHYFLMLNVFFLMCIAFLPFPTAVLGEYMTEESERKTAIAFYAFGLLLPAFSWLLIWLYGLWDDLVDETLDPSYVRFLTLQFSVSNVFFFAALVIALVLPYVALAVAVGLTLLYLLPPRQRRYIDAAGDDLP